MITQLNSFVKEPYNVSLNCGNIRQFSFTYSLLQNVVVQSRNARSLLTRYRVRGMESVKIDLMLKTELWTSNPSADVMLIMMMMIRKHIIFCIE